MGNQGSQLKKDELDDLQRATHFQSKELKNMYKQYKKETPQGVITKAEFLDVVRQMGITDAFLQDLLFRVFDKEKAGHLSFQDLVRALSVMTRGRSEEKMDFAFRLFDSEEQGFFTKKQMLEIMEAFYRLVGPQVTLSGKRYESAQQLVDDFFEQIDIDRDDRITLDEYKHGASANQDILQGLQLWNK
mmetsp:Transcript_18514/g.47069  ORF Transcript_18514/g.47069 Transcript_18514/m.47069 type:complete len:188 (-) Transcript_18514:100-663(-)|eukprot:CAMPEP_0177645608 /NCGR_PEP_ID=MMETSP0447-20121125/9339_1 /TAXON_ID=0 /ORGANISM="Stygamoeba regulata, Strain BSH-02190019" /LENGTH=187 /DNA_ID=CAMNT_0019148101 /DNA_START=267 /DNA_END=830 /DNA_ORIENTATION=-